MKFQIDMSGTDLLRNESVLAISDGNGLIKGFQMNQKIINEIFNLTHYGLFTPIPSPPPIISSASSLALMRCSFKDKSVYKFSYHLPLRNWFHWK